MKENGIYGIETSKQCAHDSYVTIETLKSMFKTVKEEYQKKFIEMYDFDSTDCYWIENVLYVADYYFDFYDVKYAVDNELLFGFLDKWYDYSLTVYENGLGNVSLESYVKGIREYSEDDINKLRELQSNYDKSKCEFDDFLTELKNGNHNRKWKPS